MFSKNDFKMTLIISFIVLEILSMLFNSFFSEYHLFGRTIIFNYSIVFFCLAFFIVDLMNDFFSSKEAEKFFFYKVYSQVLFLFLSYTAIYMCDLKDTLISNMVNESPRTIVSALIATYIGFKVMNTIMSKIKIGSYYSSSVFRRYIYSTLPGEIAFSFVFTGCSFSSGRSFQEVIQIFLSSCCVKVILSAIFALIISVLFKIKEVNLKRQDILLEETKNIF